MGRPSGRGGGRAELGGGVGDGRPGQAQQGPARPRVAEVGQLEVLAVRVAHQDVLRLQVSVHQAAGVDVLQGGGQLGGAAVHCGLWEAHLRGEGQSPVPRGHGKQPRPRGLFSAQEAGPGH